MTNADKIRQMTDEELAQFIATTDWCETIGCPIRCDGQCEKKVLDWLKQEVEE